MKTTFINSYYLLLGVITLLVASHTIYQGSRLVTFGRQVATLNQTQTQLQAEKQTLEQSLGSTISLAELERQAGERGYQPTSWTAWVTTSTTVASR